MPSIHVPRPHFCLGTSHLGLEILKPAFIRITAVIRRGRVTVARPSSLTWSGTGSASTRSSGRITATGRGRPKPPRLGPETLEPFLGFGDGFAADWGRESPSRADRRGSPASDLQARSRLELQARCPNRRPD